MKIEAKNPTEYLSKLPKDRQETLGKMRKIILKNLPKGFEETINYGMIGYVVPHSIYPNGYHCTPQLPLPFMSIASQKNFVALYHMGIYVNPPLMEWFITEYPKYSSKKLDMGKSCIRFKKMDEIPYQLIGKLTAKMSVNEWINIYENKLKKK